MLGFFEIFTGVLSAFYSLIASYGVAIILLTIVVRLILLPLSIKQTRSMREMQRIQPEIKKLQKKFKGDRQKLSEATMALYKEHGVNPLGGCLPLVLQMPVFIALFRVLQSPLNYVGPFDMTKLADALRTMPVELNRFLGIHLNCSPGDVVATLTPDRVDKLLNEEGPQAVQLAEACGNGLVTALPYLLLVLAMGFTTWYQQKQMQSGASSTDPTAQQMQTVAKVMPFLLMFFSYTFPAGLTLYWLTSNIWTIGQQRLMLRAAPPLPPLGGDGKAKKSGETKGTGKPGGAKTKAKPGAGKSAKTGKKGPQGDRIGRTSGEAPKSSGKKKRKR